MSRRMLGGIVLLLALPLTASGHWWRARPAPVVAFYYQPPVRVFTVAPVPVVVAPAPVAVVPSVPVCPPAAVPAPPLARPFAAPPSTSPEPPLSAPLPTTPTPTPDPATSRSLRVSDRFFDEYPVATRSSNLPVGDAGAVSFWNLADRDLTLRAAGQTYFLPRGQSLSLTLPRQFAWEVDGRGTQLSRIPDADAGLDVVIRR